jgi:hypothetical protein
MVLKETPTSCAEGWIAGYLHKHLKTGGIPVPPRHTAGWIHGFISGFTTWPSANISSVKDYTEGWLAGRNAFVKSAPNMVAGHTQDYRTGFADGHHPFKDPYGIYIQNGGVPVNYPD